jgi:hypothetical protein
MGNWQLWRSRTEPDVDVVYGLKVRTTPLPNPTQLDRTHYYVFDVPANVPGKDILRDYKDFVFNYANDHWNAPGASAEDVLVSPQGEVWLIELWGYKSLGIIPGGQRDPPPRQITEAEHHKAMAEGHAVRLHHPRKLPLAEGINKNDLDDTIKRQDERDKGYRNLSKAWRKGW